MWLKPEDLDDVCALAARISDLVHERAQRPRAPGTRHASVSAFVFELR